jgi:predicted transcriptional regulator
MRYRSRTEIISSILEIVNGSSRSFDDGGVSKTKIMYKVFLNYAQLQQYLLMLTERDLIRHDGQTRTFKTAEKGLDLLKAYNRIDQLIKEREI